MAAVELTCHCGAVRFTVDAAPKAVTDCNCSLCRRYGALWAYYPPDQVRWPDGGAATRTYMSGKQSIAVHHCGVCGCVTHWAAIDPSRKTMGVNARLMAPEVLSGARVRRLDGAETWTYFDE